MPRSIGKNNERLKSFKECDPEDEWAGNYSLDNKHKNLVRVVFGRPQPKGSWRVGVWGMMILEWLKISMSKMVRLKKMLINVFFKSFL